MSIPYTYCLQNLVTNQKYYGVRFAKNCNPNELWVKYFSSSKYVKELINLYGKNSFSFEVRKTFTDSKAAQNWEERVLRKLHVTTNDNWLNKNICGKFIKTGKQTQEHINKRIRRGKDHCLFGVAPQNQPFYGKKHSAETLIKLRVPKKNIENMKFHDNNKKLIKCPHCDKEGQLTNMKHWHFDNCKTIKDRQKISCEYCQKSVAKNVFTRHHGTNCKLRPKSLIILPE